jgi:hypothetical protein
MALREKKTTVGTGFAVFVLHSTSLPINLNKNV